MPRDVGGESVCRWGPYVSSLHRPRYRGRRYGAGHDVQEVKCLRDETHGLSVPSFIRHYVLTSQVYRCVYVHI